jgi:hypothetical protein
MAQERGYVLPDLPEPDDDDGYDHDRDRPAQG